MSPTYDYTNKQASFHSRQGRIWRLGSKFLLVRFRIGMSRENKSSSVRIAQLRSVNSAACFAWFHKFLEPLPKASTWAHSWCRSTVWSHGTVRRKFTDFELIPLNIHPWPTIFIAKAAIMLNNVSSVNHVNLLMNAALHWSDYRKSLPGQIIRIRLKSEQKCCLFLDILNSAIMNDLFMTFPSRLKVDDKCVY